MKQEENYIQIDNDENEENSFFFDSYAFFEIIKENNEELAETSIKTYSQFVQDFDEEVIKNAAQLKLKLNRRDLSMADCIGYEFAKQLGIKFLTGDSQFKDMENVEFVK